MTLRVMFDSNAYDAILRHDDAERIEAAMLNVIVTAAQEDEIRQIPDAAKQTALLELYHRLQSAAVVVPGDWDASRDSMIGLAAQAHCDLLVTDDKALTAAMTRHDADIRVLTYAAFRAEFLL